MDYLEFIDRFRNHADKNGLKIKSAHIACISGLYEKWAQSDFYACTCKDVELVDLCCLSLSTLARTRIQLVEHCLLEIDFERKLKEVLRSNEYRFFEEFR